MSEHIKPVDSLAAMPITIQGRPYHIIYDFNLDTTPVFPQI